MDVEAGRIELFVALMIPSCTLPQAKRQNRAGGR
jgi:hypothetical protein